MRHGFVCAGFAYRQAHQLLKHRFIELLGGDAAAIVDVTTRASVGQKKRAHAPDTIQPRRKRPDGVEMIFSGLVQLHLIRVELGHRL